MYENSFFSSPWCVKKKTKASMSWSRVVVCSGYMSPPHRGHIEYMKRSKDLAGPEGRLIVILNNDSQAVLKHGYSFMPIEDRVAIVESLRFVDEVVVSIDTDRTVIQTLTMLCARELGSRPTHFTNAGDQTNDSIPEAEVCRTHGIQLVDGLGDKVQSSRWIIGAAVAAAAAASSS
jgi:cytidyltransferase-like protein